MWLMSDRYRELAELQQMVLCLAHAFKDDRARTEVSRRIRANLNAAWHAANSATPTELPKA